MDYQIRKYVPGDLPDLTAFMNANHDLDDFSESLLAEKLERDPYWDSENALICHDKGEIIGFMLGVMRDIRGSKYGYIKLMAVDRAHRQQGIARTLYGRLEKLFRSEGATVVRFYDVPLNYYMPGIDPRYTEAVCFAMAMGFKRFGDSLNMIVDLPALDLETEAEENKLRSQGIEIARPEKADLEQVLDFVRRDWALWEHEVSMAFADDPPSLHAAWKNGEVMAFSAHNGNNKGTGWFGPMGTHSGLRGMGIGGILLKRCLKDMKQMGHEKAIIPWVDPIAFYALNVGARIDRVFWRYEKSLNYE